MSDLSALLQRSLEGLAMDLLVGRHGDPHVGFVVFVYPDRGPEIIALTPAGTGRTPLSHIVTRDEKDPESKGKDSDRFFSFEDLEDAAHGLTDAMDALRAHGSLWYRRYDKERQPGETLGQHIARHVATTWARRRDIAMNRAMAVAAEELKPQCPHCKRRFTDRGLKMHLARAWHCARRQAETQAQEGVS